MGAQKIRSRVDAKVKVRVMWLGNGCEVFFACAFVLSEINKTVNHCKELSPPTHTYAHTHTYTHTPSGSCMIAKWTATMHPKSAQM